MESLQHITDTRGLSELRKAGEVILSTRGLCKAFGGQVVLKDVSLDLRRGEVVLLRGENGSGKTTLLNTLTGNLEPDEGIVRLKVNGTEEVYSFPQPWWRSLNPFDHFTPERVAKGGIGRTWQEVRLFPTQNLRDNVAVAVQDQIGENPAWAILKCVSVMKQETEILKRSVAMLDDLGLRGRESSSGDKVSLGQCKRVAIARTLQAGAKVLFLDEPLAGLDAAGASDVLGLLEELVHDHKVTLVIVEHVLNIPLLLSLATTVWTLAGGEITVTNPQEVQRDAERAVGERMHGWLEQVAGPGGEVRNQALPGGGMLFSAIRAGAEQNSVLLEVKDLVVSRGKRLVIGERRENGSVSGLSFSLRKGHLTILQAPNGWGKTTLLESLAGVLPVSCGTIRLNGQPIQTLEPWKSAAAGLFFLQSRNHSFPSCSVREALQLARVPEIPESVKPLVKKQISDLSGGEKQKVAIACMRGFSRLVVAVLDEPFSALDSNALADFQKQIGKLGHEVAILIAVPSMIQEGSRCERI